MVSQEVVIPDELTDHARSTIAVLHGGDAFTWVSNNNHVPRCTQMSYFYWVFSVLKQLR